MIRIGELHHTTIGLTLRSKPYNAGSIFRVIGLAVNTNRPKGAEIVTLEDVETGETYRLGFIAEDLEPVEETKTP